MKKISFIQWFIRLIKRDMKEFERKEEEEQEKYIRKTKNDKTVNKNTN